MTQTNHHVDDRSAPGAAGDGGSGNMAALVGSSAPKLQRRVVIWTVSLIIVSTAACALWLNHIAENALDESHARHITSLGQALAAAVASDAGDSSAHIDDLFDSLAYDGRFAFVILSDSQGVINHRRIFDPHAWSLFRQQVEQASTAADASISQPTALKGASDLVVQKLPILIAKKQIGFRPQDAMPERKLKGFVTLALREPAVPRALLNLKVMHLVVALSVCLLAVPIVVVAVRRWTQPLRKLLVATERLAAGEKPQPVTVSSDDELKTLAESFNEMAAAIIEARTELEQINETLEQKVIDRTSELQQAYNRLEVEIHDKNDFLRAVSHDLSAPLRNIEGMAKMLVMKYGDKLDDNAKSKIERINANVKTQAGLINDLLELSRIRTRPGKAQQVDLDAMVDELVATLGFDLEEKQITVKKLAKLPTIYVSQNRIRQVFQNLIDNAIKYMRDSGEKRITIDYQLDRAAGGNAHHFTVTDTGCGISQEDQPRVFQVFTRAANETTSTVSGKGVGLATVKSIVEMLDGQIWVESTLGRGSSFHFTVKEAKVTQLQPTQQSA